MKGIAYLVRTTFKNQLRELIRTPARLIATLLIVALFVTMLFSSPSEDTSRMPLSYLTAGITALFAVMFFLIARNGLNAGASFYTMPVVSLLFSAPGTRRAMPSQQRTSCSKRSILSAFPITAAISPSRKRYWGENSTVVWWSRSMAMMLMP